MVWDRMAFLKEERGGAAAEFAVIILVFMIGVFAVIDFGRLAWEYNKLEKATQIGARFAAVNHMVAPGLWTYDGVGTGGVAPGDPVPIANINGGNPIVCTSSSGSATCSPNTYGSSTPAFDAIVTRMRRIVPYLDSADVTISYQHIGLGFAGNSLSSDITPSVTVEISGQSLSFITPPLAILGSVNLPVMATTLTGEHYDAPPP